MDDQEFDNGIRQKLANYEEPGFDPAALSGLHARIDAVPLPWYARYRTEFITLSGLAVCTVIMLSYLHYTTASTERLLEQQRQLMTDQQAELIQLKKEVNQIRAANPDTIWITSTQAQPASYTVLIDRIARLERTIQSLSQVHENSQAPSSGLTTHTFSESPSETISTPYTHRTFPREKEVESLHAVPTDQVVQDDVHEKQLSPKAIRELERHYNRGVGVRIGPTAEMSYGFYPQAEGGINVGLGVLADIILSPSLSLETGAKYARRYYQVESLNDAELPGVDQTLGEFNVAEIDTWAIEIPINLKYRSPITTKTHWLTGIGYSPVIYYKQVFEYEYFMPQNHNYTIGASHENNKVQLYAGTFNLSAGLSFTLKNKKIIETSLYYQRSLGEAGIEQVTPNYFGIRGVYWFKVR